MWFLLTEEITDAGPMSGIQLGGEPVPSNEVFHRWHKTRRMVAVRIFNSVVEPIISISLLSVVALIGKKSER